MGAENRQDLGVPTKVHDRDPQQLKPIVEELLRAEFPGRAGLAVASLDLPSGAGVANETLLLDVAWQGGREGLVLRLDSVDKLFVDPSFADHFHLYQAIREQGAAPVPRVFGLCTGPNTLGRPYFFMERVNGRVPSDQPPFHSQGWVAELTPDTRHSMWTNAVAALAALHRTPVPAVDFLGSRGGAARGLDALLERELRTMHDALAGARHPIIEAGADWLRRHFPASPEDGFSWGDSRPQNLIFDGERVAAVLDWDMASLAGAEPDLAWWTLLDFSVTRSRGVPRLEGWGSPRETIARWEELSGRRARNMEWHFVFAAFRSAVIVTKLAKMLDRRGHLPAASRGWIDNSTGVQYLGSLLGLPPLTSDSHNWPGLD